MKMYSSILVYSFANLGDVLLSTAAVALLKKSYPQAKISMMVKPPAAGLITNNPLVDEVIIFDKEKVHTFKEQLRFVKRLKAHHFDLAISLDGKPRAGLLAWLARIPTRVGPDRLFGEIPHWVTRLYTHTIRMPIDIADRLQVINFQDIVRSFTGSDQSAHPVMAVPTDEEEAKAQRLIEGLPRAQYWIVLCVKGTFELKDWPQEHFAALIDALVSRYEAAFFIIGAPGDRAYADQVIALAKTPVANFCGQTSLGELAALLKLVSLFITVDTGAAHIAATTGVPMVEIFGCTSPRRWYPQSDVATVVSHNLSCCPCAHRADGCPNGKACLMEITVDEVLAAIDNVLKKKENGLM